MHGREEWKKQTMRWREREREVEEKYAVRKRGIEEETFRKAREEWVVGGMSWEGGRNGEK